MPLRTATATIDIQALLTNLRHIRHLAQETKILAVLKANAYGHGLELIAKALSQSTGQADAFGVARIEEALALRAVGIIKPIVLLEGFFNHSDLNVIEANNFQTVIHNKQQLELILSANLERPINVWLKIDTGMHRLGISPEEFEECYRLLESSDNVDSSITLMSHLACADDVKASETLDQIMLFDEITQSLEQPKSLGNSAGISAWSASHYQWVRPGIMLYGVSPLAGHKSDENLLPVMTLQSSVIAKRTLSKGDKVGYGGNWVAEKNTTIAVIAIGYGDGYPRHAKNGTPVLLNGRIVPLIGRVSMDMITVDLGDNSTDEIGDIATLWGNGLPIEQVAEWATTIPYELLCNISRRVHVSVQEAEI